ncbi:MAG: outer membrane beta-barrel protein [Alphaproteobacteria bacterium]|nr:outer membrane beta-barrel protein [Alphaproteobacteria bacterium]
MHRVLLVVIAASLGVADGAQAASPGNGVRIGDAKLVPSAVVGLEFSSNPYLAEGGNGESATVPAFNLMVQPAARLDSITTPLELHLSADLTARKFLSSTTTNLDRASDANAMLKANILPKAPVGVMVQDTFFNQNRPSEARFADRSKGRRPFITQLHNDTGAFVSVHPGGALTIDVGGQFVYDNFRTNPGSSFTGQDYLNSRTSYGPGLNVEWAFFPKTALVGGFSYDWYNWDKQVINTVGGAVAEFSDPLLAMPDSRGWRANAGVVGRFTRKLVLNAIVGYGMLTYDTESVTSVADAYSSIGELDVSQGWDASVRGKYGVTAIAQLAYTPRKGHTVSAGYIRDYEDSWFTNFVAYNYAFAKYEGTLSRRFRVSVDGGYRLESYLGHLARQDHVVRATGYFTYQPLEWLEATASVGWRRRAASNLDPSTFAVQSSREYDNIPVSLLFTFRY